MCVLGGWGWGIIFLSSHCFSSSFQNERIYRRSPEKPKKLHLFAISVFSLYSKSQQQSPSVLLSLHFSSTKKQLVFFNGRLPSNASLKDYALSYMSLRSIIRCHFLNIRSSPVLPRLLLLFRLSSPFIDASLIHHLLHSNNTHLLILRTETFSMSNL